MESKCEADGLEPLELLTKFEQNNFIALAKAHSLVQKNEFIHIGKLIVNYYENISKALNSLY